jgi:hypothetical protein
VWHTGRRVEVRHIQIAPFGDGWTVGEASLDNAQFFQRRSHAEAAALDMGSGLPTQVSQAGSASTLATARLVAISSLRARRSRLEKHDRQNRRQPRAWPSSTGN